MILYIIRCKGVISRENKKMYLIIKKTTPKNLHVLNLFITFASEIKTKMYHPPSESTAQKQKT